MGAKQCYFPSPHCAVSLPFTSGSYLMVAFCIFLWVVGLLQHRGYFPYPHGRIAMETVGLLCVLRSSGNCWHFHVLHFILCLLNVIIISIISFPSQEESLRKTCAHPSCMLLKHNMLPLLFCLNIYTASSPASFLIGVTKPYIKCIQNIIDFSSDLLEQHHLEGYCVRGGSFQMKLQQKLYLEYQTQDECIITPPLQFVLYIQKVKPTLQQKVAVPCSL